MKKACSILAAALLGLCVFSCATVPTDSSRTSLDWAGMYAGITPAADAEGIKVVLILNGDETYTMTQQYIGKGDEVFTTTGKFTWDKRGSVITLDIKNSPPCYIVGENKVTQLDMKGKKITGQFAEMYILQKQ